jgi:hypothetical protein
VCKVRACPYVGEGLCVGHELQQAGAWPLTRPGVVVDLGEPRDLEAEPRPASTALVFTPPRGQTALETWGRRLAERRKLRQP